MHLEHLRRQVLYHSHQSRGRIRGKCFVMLGCPHGLELWCNSVKVNLNLSSKRRGKSKGVEKTKLYKSPPKKLFYSTSLVKNLWLPPCVAVIQLSCLRTVCSSGRTDPVFEDWRSALSSWANPQNLRNRCPSSEQKKDKNMREKHCMLHSV